MTAFKAGANKKRGRRRKLMREKVCRLCEAKVTFIDFKDVEMLKRHQTEGGKILPRRITGTCAKHQKMLTAAIKLARNLALVL